MKLIYDYRAPAVASADGSERVLILMHGRGANRADMAGLEARLPGTWHVVIPDAPHPGAPWGYGPGLAWYRFMGDDRPDPASLDASLSALDDLVADLPRIIGAPPTHIVLGGFSQGGTTANAYALTRPGVARGALNFSGFLPSHLSLSGDVLKDTRFFWGHGVDDPAIPFALAVKGRAALRAAGADLETHDYDIGHWIDPVELRDASSWLESL